MFQAVARCPASISFIFKSVFNKNILNSGSIGIGSTVDKNVEAASKLSSEKSRIRFNNRTVKLPTVAFAIDMLTKIPVDISIKSELPLGSGFGISGASTLSALFSVNKLLKLDKSERQLAEIAHISEIKNRTGLGTIATQITGGFLIKSKPGIPPDFRRLNFSGKKIYATVAGTLKTPQILSNPEILKKINEEADLALDEANNKNDLTIEDVLHISYNYCQRSHLIKSDTVNKIIEQIKNDQGTATMAILGETVLSTKRPKNANYPIFELTLAESTAA